MRAGIVFSLCLGLATVAYAQSTFVDGRPQDVAVWAPGVYSVSSSTTTELRRDNNIDAVFSRGDVVGTFLRSVPSECFTGINREGLVVSPDLCWRPGSIFPGDFGVTQLNGVRFTPSGAGYAMGSDQDNLLRLLFSRPGEVGDPPWDELSYSTLVITRPTSAVLAVTEMDGGVLGPVPHVLFRSAPRRLLWYRQDRNEAELQTSDPAAILGVDLVATGGEDPVALYGSNSGIFRAQLSPSTRLVDNAFSRVSVEGNPPVSIVSLDVNTGSGSEHGEGFGLAVGSLEGSPDFVVLGAVPADSAEDAGTLWRIHQGIGVPAGPPAAALQVSCVDSTYCVITLDRENTDGDNLIVYTNGNAPQLAAPDGGTSPRVLDEGGAALSLPFTAIDDDGDAVRLSLDVSTVPAFVGVSTVSRPDSLDVTLTPREVCQDSDATLRVFASDGLKAHDQQSDLRVRVRNTLNPGQPGVAPTLAVSYGEPTVFTASDVPGLCDTVGYQWTSAPELATDGGATATFTPPLNVLCSATGGSYAYTVRGLDPGLLPSAPASFTVEVSPWGRPLPPFGPDARRALDSRPDAGVDLRPEVLHTCIRDLNLPREQLPPLETVWSLTDATAGVPTGITFRGADGGTVSVQSPVTSDTLRVEAAECIRASLSLTARNRMLTGSGTVDGPAATVQVEVRPPVEDIASTVLVLGVAANDTSTVEVGYRPGTAPVCESEKVKARMVLVEQDGRVVVGPQDVSVPGTWSPALLELCAGTYTVRGTPVDQRPKDEQLGGDATTTLAVRPRLEALESGELVARCGEGVRGQLTQPIAPARCTSQTVTWTQVDESPRVLDTPLPGQSVTVDSSDSTPLEELVGQTVTVRVTAEAGPGNVSTREHELFITAEPFVEVRHTLESPVSSEQQLVGVVVELSNTTTCGVGRLSYVERVEGLAPIPGTVKLDGQPVAETAVEGGFRVEDVTLADRGTTRLTYVSRPLLLTPPRFSGEVFLNGVPVTGGLPPPSSSGCGCSGGGTGAAAFGLAALVRLLRRRRG